MRGKRERGRERRGSTQGRRDVGKSGGRKSKTDREKGNEQSGKESEKGGEDEERNSFAHYLFNSLESNFSPTVGVSIIVVTVIKHFGNVGDFLFLKPPCQ